jgi:hypothetical protein
MTTRAREIQSFYAEFASCLLPPACLPACHQHCPTNK